MSAGGYKKVTERIIVQISTGTLYLHSRHIGLPSQMDSSSKITSSIFVVWVWVDEDTSLKLGFNSQLSPKAALDNPPQALYQNAKLHFCHGLECDLSQKMPNSFFLMECTQILKYTYGPVIQIFLSLFLIKKLRQQQEIHLNIKEWELKHMPVEYT